MAKVTQTRDVQAQTFGFAANVASAFAVPQATTCTISSLDVTSAAITSIAANTANGMMLLASTNATFASGTIVYGIVQSNTGPSTTPVFTVDAWYNLNGSAGSQPVTGFYVLLPVAPPFWFIALTDSVSAVAGTETGAALGGTEHTANGLGRAKVTTVTRTVGSTSATMANTFTFTGGSSTNIGRASIVNSKTASKNYTYFVDQINSGTPAVVSSNGDTFTPTWTLTLG